MVLEINEQLLGFTFAEQGFLDESKAYPLGCKLIYEPVIYIFDPDSFAVCRKNSDEAEAVENPIMFPSVTRAEAQKAYISFLNDPKLSAVFNGLGDKEYWDTFWNYFDDGGEKFAEFNRFEKYYRIKSITDWCEINNIPYYINNRDEFIRSISEFRLNGFHDQCKQN